MDLISVIIPTYNCAHFLGDAVRSVLAQTHDDLEVLVIDDGSTDDPAAALTWIRDSRVRLIRQDQSGPSAARNRGILESRGDYVAFLDADDLWRPTKLARQLDLMKREPETVLVYSDFCRGPDPAEARPGRLNGYKHRATGDVFHALMRENFIHPSAALVRCEALSASGLFDPLLRGSEDFDLWLRLARAGRVGCVDEVLVGVRRHDGNTTRGVQFLRNQVRTTRLLLERWGDDAEAASLLRRRLAVCCYTLGQAEQDRGDHGPARSAYWESARLGHRPPEALARAAAMLLPPEAVSLLRRGRRP